MLLLHLVIKISSLTEIFVSERKVSMPETHNDIHAKLIDDWEKAVATKIKQEQHIKLIEKAIKVVEARSLHTLSSITYSVIVDRVIHQSSKKYPLLLKTNLKSGSFNFKEVHQDNSHSRQMVLEALRFLLLELLRILGRITAEILTTPLHQEILKVTLTDSEDK